MFPSTTARAAALLLTIIAAIPARGQSGAGVPSLTPEDLVLEEGRDGGYHLWVRDKPGIGSVLLTESTADPTKTAHSYALRAPTYNAINGDEKRVLNGEFLQRNKGIVDSTPEPHAALGAAYHLFIPYVVEYGYPWSRQGEVLVTVGTFLNIKAFAKPFADWEGGVRDNPFVIALLEEQSTPPPALEVETPYIPDTVEQYTRIARQGGGEAHFAPEKKDLLTSIGEIIDRAEGPDLDLVLALDTTLSMKDEMPVLQQGLVPVIRDHTARFEHVRAAVLFYRDYFEQYLVKPLPFVEDLRDLQRQIDTARVHGGKEIPEAVHEALYASLESYAWRASARQIILIGDAPPHERPRGKVTEQMVYDLAAESGVRISTIILPP